MSGTEILTAVVAVYAAGLSTLLAVHTIRSNKPRFKVKHQIYTYEGLGLDRADSIIYVTNDTPHPSTITFFGLLTTEKDAWHMNIPDPAVELPVRVGPHSTVEFGQTLGMLRTLEAAALDDVDPSKHKATGFVVIDDMQKSYVGKMHPLFYQAPDWRDSLTANSES